MAGPWARWSRLSRASPVGAASQNLGGPQFGAAFVFALQHFPKGRVIRSVTTATPSQRQLARLLDAEPALLASLLDVHPGRAHVRHVPTGPGVGRGDWGMPGPRLRVKAVGAGIDTRRGVTLPQPRTPSDGCPDRFGSYAAFGGGSFALARSSHSFAITARWSRTWRSSAFLGEFEQPGSFVPAKLGFCPVHGDFSPC
jgi:hypothetical protein